MNDKNDYVPTRRRTVIPSDVTVVPQVDRLISDAMSIIGSELAYYRTKTKGGAVLTEKEARIMHQYIDCLVKLSKEAREASKLTDFSNLSNEELLDLAESLVKKGS